MKRPDIRFRDKAYKWSDRWPDIIEDYYTKWLSTEENPPQYITAHINLFQKFIDMEELKLQDQLQTTELSITEI